MRHINKDEPLEIRRPEINFTIIENALIEHHHKIGLNLYDFGFIVHLLKWAFGSRRLWPSLRTLGQEMGLHYANVRRKLLQLEENGFLRIERRTNGNKQYSSVLDLTPLYEKLNSVVRETTPVVRETTPVVRETTEEEKRRKTRKKLNLESEKREGEQKPENKGLTDKEIKRYVEILYKEGKVKNPEAFLLSTKKALSLGDLNPDDIKTKLEREKRKYEIKKKINEWKEKGSEAENRLLDEEIRDTLKRLRENGKIKKLFEEARTEVMREFEDDLPVKLLTVEEKTELESKLRAIINMKAIEKSKEETQLQNQEESREQQKEGMRL